MAAKKGQRSWGHIRQLPNKSKRWQASYCGPDLKRHNAPTTFSTRLRAEGYLAKERELIELGTWSPPALREARKHLGEKAMTLAEYGDRWIKERPLKDLTRTFYERAFELHVKQGGLGTLPISALTQQAVREWYAGLLVDKPTMRARVYTLLASICETAFAEDELMVRNPCQINGARTVIAAKTHNVPTISELEAISGAIDPRFRMFILLTAWTGMRLGEISELRRKDVIFTDDGIAVINLTRGVTHDRGICRIDTPKNGKGRTVYVPPHIVSELKAHLNSLAETVGNRQLGKAADDGDQLIFPRIRSSAKCPHIHPKPIRDALDKATSELGLAEIRIHTLRHFQGSIASRVANVTEVKERLGHSSNDMALHYSHQINGRDLEIARDLSSLYAREVIS